MPIEVTGSLPEVVVVYDKDDNVVEVSVELEGASAMEQRMLGRIADDLYDKLSK